MNDVFQSRLLKQQAVYWPPLGENADGTMEYGESVEIKCLWIDMQMEYINAKGDKTVSKSLILVDRDLETGGMIWLGKLQDLADQDEPNKNKGATIIEGWNKIPVPPSLKKFTRMVIA